MRIGIPKELKAFENRVAVTPAGVHELVAGGHDVYVQTGAGVGSGFSDVDYTDSGARILPTIEETYAIADMIVKVKEPIQEEYSLIRENQIVFTYFHFASSLELTKAMIKSKAVCIAYETVELPDRSLPLLVPMSEVAGRMAIQEGARFLEKPHLGKGVLLGGVPGVKPAHVVVIGGGVVGAQSAWIAAGMGARVTVLDKSLPRLRYLSDVMPANVTTRYSDTHTITELCKDVDLIVGAVLIAGDKAPQVVTRDMLKLMQPGTVLVDVAIDQGGCFETSRPTTHLDPVFVIDEVVHYCVANIPGAVPMTSTLALTNATLPYALELANLGWEEACRQYKDLRKGLNIIKGDVVYKAVAHTFGLEYKEY
ncbi:alanine dehydrogenase [Dysgonomonas sp. PFB1-18]|uniref:alanine dehydrogenase n=1 Tax=unclassified Dysgonomonas TaxID=2630389 RepID=UPI0024731A02|nr:MULTISPECIES: alanine dehydrogenase [unclassified Dysgonomonas]MDH6309194.1 alanine dehydrogenase [Dysgonomonas sp. PF1-14]MDH6338926.1 alanine dehydrogenase [Dysgonomonas sp. PF1-16]MDH6380443.1 alanine dehydrogenase [Dysgonomonas sp. PFB1-18]MDH6397754.1 alanine dehydrogenase [Dysgonomonas sp. PF1-23]